MRDKIKKTVAISIGVACLPLYCIWQIANEIANPTYVIKIDVK